MGDWYTVCSLPTSQPIDIQGCQRIVCIQAYQPSCPVNTKGEPMSEASTNSGQWVTCPRCSKAFQRTSMPENRSFIAWLDYSRKACSPACLQKVQKSRWWLAVLVTFSAVCFTGSFVLITLRSPSPVIRWTSLVVLILLWALALAHWSMYRYAGRRMRITDDIPHTPSSGTAR
jgi:hypothetical protein